MGAQNGKVLSPNEVKKAAEEAVMTFTQASESVQSTFELIPGGEGERLGKIMGEAIRKLGTMVDADALNASQLIRVIQIGTDTAAVVAGNQLKAARAFIEMRKLRAQEAKERQQSRLRTLLIKQAELNNEEKAARLVYRYGKGKQSRKEVLDFFAALSQMRAGVSDEDLALLEQVSTTADSLFAQEQPADEADENARVAGGTLQGGEVSIPTGDLPPEADPAPLPQFESADPGAVHEQPVREDARGPS